MSTNSTPLSPAAQAVMDAANNFSSFGPEDCLNESRWIAAAALRAVADQVVPEQLEPQEPVQYGIGADCGKFIDDWAQWKQSRHTRVLILAIANELDPQP